MMTQKQMSETIEVHKKYDANSYGECDCGDTCNCEATNDLILADLERKQSPARSIIGKTLNFDSIKYQYKARFIEWLRMKAKQAKATVIQSNDCDCVECQCSRCPDTKERVARSLLKHSRLVDFSCDCDKCMCAKCPVIPPQLVKFHDKYKEFNKRLKRPNSVSCSTSIDDPGLPGCDCLDCQGKRKDPLKFIILSLSDTVREVQDKRDVLCATSLTNFGHAVLCDCVECQHDRAKERKNFSKRVEFAPICDCPCTHQEERIECECESCQCLHIPDVEDTICYCPVCNCHDFNNEDAKGKECDCRHCEVEHDFHKCDCSPCQCKDESVCEQVIPSDKAPKICEEICNEEIELKNIMVCIKYPKTIDIIKNALEKDEEFVCDCVPCQCPGRSDVDECEYIQEQKKCTCNPCNCGQDECKCLDPNEQGLDFPCEEDTCPFYPPKDNPVDVCIDETCPALNEIMSEAKARKDKYDKNEDDEGEEDACACEVCGCAFCLAYHQSVNKRGSEHRAVLEFCNCVESVCKSCNRKMLTNDESDKGICHCLTCDCQPCQKRKLFTDDICKVQSCDCDTCKKPIWEKCECCVPCQCNPCKSLKSEKCKCNPCTKCDYCTYMNAPTKPPESGCNCGKCDCLACTKLNKPHKAELKCTCDPCKCHICKATRVRYYCGCDPGECECTECDLETATVECVCSKCECYSCLNDPCVADTNLLPVKEPAQADELCKCCGPCPCEYCNDKPKRKTSKTVTLICAKCQKIMTINDLYEKSGYGSKDPKNKGYINSKECLLCHLPKLPSFPLSNPDCIRCAAHLRKTGGSNWIKELMPFGPFSEKYQEKILDTQKKSDDRMQEINIMKEEMRKLQLKFKKIKGFDPLTAAEQSERIKSIKLKDTSKITAPPNVVTLKLQIIKLEEKCMVKDQIIDKIVKNIKHGSKSILDEMSRERLISDCKRIDYDRQKVADRLLSETEETKKNFFKGSDGSNMGLVVIRRIGERSVMVKWDLPEHEGVIGYELFSNGESLQKIYSPTRSIAIVRNLPDAPKVELSLKCMTESGHLPKSSHTTYIPEEYNDARENSINSSHLEDTKKRDVTPTLSRRASDSKEVSSRHSIVINEADSPVGKNTDSEDDGQQSS